MKENTLLETDIHSVIEAEGPFQFGEESLFRQALSRPARYTRYLVKNETHTKGQRGLKGYLPATLLWTQEEQCPSVESFYSPRAKFSLKRCASHHTGFEP